jgi:hypothetical protein
VHAGFGRIGRLVLRATLDRKDVKVVAINGEYDQPLLGPTAAVSMSVNSTSPVLVLLLVSELHCYSCSLFSRADPFIEPQYAAYMFKVSLKSLSSKAAGPVPPMSIPAVLADSSTAISKYSRDGHTTLCLTCWYWHHQQQQMPCGTAPASTPINSTLQLQHL